MNVFKEENLPMKTNIKSILSHGKESNRIYLMHMCHADFPAIIDYLDDLADTHQYTKIFAKIPSSYAPSFIGNGYVIEAHIPAFFYGKEDVMFLVKYKQPSRKVLDDKLMESFQTIFMVPPKGLTVPLENTFSIRQLTINDTNSIIDVFKEVFETYPFPIFDPNFIKKSMTEDGTIYFGVFHDNKLIAVSSAECNGKEQNAEMTDFAVLPTYRGHHLAIHLLAVMEQELSKKQFKTVYTISRLKSLPMNKTFYNSGYQYTGTLIQNTQISGNIESMNVWYKDISKID